MATMLEDYTTEELSSLVLFFLSVQRVNAKDIRKEMFPVCGGKRLSRKAVQPQ
jgi:uncharacterized protein YktA (UPF0223 family)